jgi:hypothetical protein
MNKLEQIKLDAIYHKSVSQAHQINLIDQMTIREDALN